MKDILVFTPVLRLEGETVRALLGLEWEGPLSLLLQRDNRRQRERAQRAQHAAPLQDGVGPSREDQWADHLWQYQRARELFLKGRFEGLLVIESDVIPPPDALQRLARVEADVAFGVYVFRGGNVVNVLERYYAGTQKKARNVGESLTVRGLYEKACRQGVVECSGSGLGCVLIRRRVIEEIPFEARPDGQGFFDWSWTEKVYRAGYSMKADMGVRCGHVEPGGNVLWPPEGSRVAA